MRISLHISQKRSILDPSGRVRQGLSFTTAGSCPSAWPIGIAETTRSDTRLSRLAREAGIGVATHPVAQLSFRVIPNAKSLQHPHRSLQPRTHSFHTIYDGCGCAGGLVTTVEGELVPRTDQSGNARRKQKSYADILGRTYKNETYEWNGTTVYSTLHQSFNGRDQVLRNRQYAGNTSSTTYQDTTASFDGHGRLHQSHRPEQRDNSNNLKYTTYSYNPDDSILSVTDGRGAVTNLEYNSRGLLTEKSWTVPTGSGITDPADVTFSYDNLGNRTAMTDAMGTMAYTYDSLSRMTSETRDFTDNLADAPANGLFTLTYEYMLTGLKSYTDPYGEEIEYAYHKTGRLSAVTGTSFAGVTTYANNPAYRAWGAAKHLEYGSGRQMEIAYDNRLRAASSEVNEIASPSTKWFDKDYEYYADGRLKLADESGNVNWNKFDRLFKYDHQARVTVAKSGVEAHGQTETDLSKLPYRQSYEYNAFGAVTQRDSTLWDYPGGGWDFSYNIANNRAAGMSYDSDGRVTMDHSSSSFAHDGAGRTVATARSENYETVLGYDGDGRESKRSQRTWEVDSTEDPGEWGEWGHVYFVNSTVLANVVSEINSTGKKKFTYVVTGAGTIARQIVDGSNAEYISWRYADPSGLSVRSSTDGAPADLAFRFEERDALGNDVGSLPNLTPPDRSQNAMSSDGSAFQSPDDGHCEIEGLFGPCGIVEGLTLPNGGAWDDHYAGLANTLTHGNPLPFEHSGRRRRNTTHPMAIARDILRRNGMFDPIFLAVSGGGESAPGLSNYSDADFYRLIGNNLQIRPDLPDWVKEIYQDKKLAKKLTDCINAVFGAKTVTINGVTATGASHLTEQKIANAPYVDEASWSRYELAGATTSDVRAYGAVFPDYVHSYDRAKQNSWIPGEVYIANDIPETGVTMNGQHFSQKLIKQKTYVHELGNVLSAFLTRAAGFNSPDGRFFGEPNGVPFAANPNGRRDDDTGAALEKCVYNTPQLIP